MRSVPRLHGTSLTGALKYPAHFTRFAFANPRAPKGGEARLSANGSFDSFNPFIQKGDPAAGLGMVFESLMIAAPDRGSEEYGLIAEWIAYPEDHSWVAFGLREEATFADGHPVTAADVVFSFDLLKGKGQPFYAFYYADVIRARDMGGNVVRFDFAVSGNRELPHIVGQLRILPRHWWTQKGRDFSRASLTVPLGSGPYGVSRFEAGRFVEFALDRNYWGARLPCNVGAHNFARIRFEYFRDESAALEAFKAGRVDFREENSAKRWADGYDFPARRESRVVLEEIALEGPRTVQCFVFNERRARFSDPRVREALSLAFDFEWTNKTIFRNQYARPVSYFQGSPDLMAEGAPRRLERDILESLKAPLPEGIFSSLPPPPVSDGSGRIRARLRQASRLLGKAGWTVAGGLRVNGAGEVFTLEFLSAQDTQGAVIDPFLKNLEILGIRAGRVLVDGPQYVERIASFDYDMLISSVANSESPGNEQRDFWGSRAADRPGSRNLAGVKEPAVDALIERIVLARDREELAAASRALDRLLRLGHHMIFELYTPFARIAYWTRIARPSPGPARTVGFPTWWWEKASR